METTKSSSLYEKLSLHVLIATVVIAPLFFVPSITIPFEFSKVIVMLSGVLLSAVLLVFSKTKGGEIILPKVKVMTLSVAIVAISLILSSIFGGNFYKSFIGYGIETSTVLFIAFLILTALLTAILAKTKENIFYLTTGWGISFILIVLFQLFHFVIGPKEWLGILSPVTGTPLESWTDLSLYAGIGVVVSLVGLSVSVSRRITTGLFSMLFVVSALLLATIGNPIPWFIIGVISTALLIFGVRAHIVGHGLKHVFSSKTLLRKAVIVPLIFACLAFVMAEKGQGFALKAYQVLGIDSNRVALNGTDLALPWQATVDVVADIVKASPFLGGGPNRFINQFFLNRPLTINTEDFWMLDFNSAFGYFPTLFANQGLLGVLGWLLALGTIFALGVRALLKKGLRMSILIPFAVSAYLIFVAFVSVPSHSLFFVTAIFIGLFFAALVQEGIVETKTISFLSKKDTLSKITGIVIIIMLVVWGGWYVKKFVGAVYFQRALMAFNAGNLDQAHNLAVTATGLGDGSDAYYRVLSQISLYQVNALITQNATSSSAESVAQRAKKLVDEVASASNAAVRKDPLDYYNHLSVARAAAAFVPLKIADMYEIAIASYSNASKLNPNNPTLYFEVAQLEASRNNFADAKRFIGKSIELKNNYIEPIFLLSQIQVAEGATKDAITSVQVALQIQPRNPLINFQLGLLKYNDKDYKGASEAFKNAVDLDGNYSNARYFLGLSYARLAKNTEAIEQFEIIQKLNPDNTEVALILTNLNTGRSPFEDIKAPLDSTPEKRKQLPVTTTKKGAKL